MRRRNVRFELMTAESGIIVKNLHTRTQFGAEDNPANSSKKIEHDTVTKLLMSVGIELKLNIRLIIQTR